jgi:hypothetical protein
MIHPKTSTSNISKPVLTLWGIKSIKILQRWNQLNVPYSFENQGYTQAFHQLLHDICEFSGQLQLKVNAVQNQDYSDHLIQLLLDATCGKHDTTTLNTFIKNQWKTQVSLLAPEVIPYFYIFQLEQDRRFNDRRTEEGYRRNVTTACSDNRRNKDRRKFISI